MYARFKSRSSSRNGSSSTSPRPVQPSRTTPPSPSVEPHPSKKQDKALLPPPSLRDRFQAEVGREAERAEGVVVQRERRRSEELERQGSASTSSRGREAGVWSGWDRNSTSSLVSRTGSLDDQHTIRGPPSFSSSNRANSRPRPPLARNTSVPSSPLSTRFAATTPSPRDEFHGFDLPPLSPASYRNSPLLSGSGGGAGGGQESCAFPPQESPALSTPELEQPARPSRFPSQQDSSSLRRHGRFPDDAPTDGGVGDETDSTRSSRDEDDDDDEQDFTPVLLPSLLQNQPSTNQTRDFDQRSSDLTTISEERSSRMASTRSNSVAGSSIANTHHSSEGGRSSTFSGAGWEAGGGGRQTMVSSVFGEGMMGMREEPEQEAEEEEARRRGDALSEGSKKEGASIFYSSKSTSEDPSSSKSPAGSPDKPREDDESLPRSNSNGITPGLEVPEFPLPPSTRPSLDAPSSSSNGGIEQPPKRKLSPAEAIAAQVREDDLLRASSPMSALPPATASAPPGDGDGNESRILDSHDGAGAGALVASPSGEDPPRQSPIIGASTPPPRVSTPPRPALLVSPPSGDLLKAHTRQASIDRDLPPLPPTASAFNSETTIVPTSAPPRLSPNINTTSNSPLTTHTPTQKTPSSVLFASALLTNHASNLHTTASSLNQRAQDLSYASNEMLRHGRQLVSSSFPSSSSTTPAEEEDSVKMLESSAILHRGGREMMEEAIRLSGRALEVASREVKEARDEEERMREGWQREREGWRKEREGWEAEKRGWEEERTRRAEEEEEVTRRRKRGSASLPFGSVGRSYHVGGLDVPEDVISLNPSLPPSRPHTKHYSEFTTTSGGSNSPPLTPGGPNFLPQRLDLASIRSPNDDDTPERAQSLSPSALAGTWKRSISMAGKKIRRRMSSESSAGGGEADDSGEAVGGGRKKVGGGVRVKGVGLWGKVGGGSQKGRRKGSSTGAEGMSD